ncbi:MAG: hypothetical protein KAU07_02805 [Candidatus Andersenbacteria bacterium]|nr:hypothetical protein [Candidatus Andersenbacteria bacterium]
MDTVSNKIVGYLLLAVGLVIIFWSIYASYNIFTAKKEAPKVFSYNSEGVIDLDSKDENVENAGAINIDKSKLTDPNYLKSLEAEQKAQAESMIKDQISGQLKEIIPEEFILKLLNLSSWSLFVFILIFAGGKISGLGIKLMKD